MAELELEISQPEGWEKMGTVTMDELQGLRGPTRFEYDTQYIVKHAQLVDAELQLSRGKQASVHLDGGLFTAHGEPEVNAVLRDLIPSGWARSRLVQALNVSAGPAADWTLLTQCTHSPIGNIRVRPADVSTGSTAPSFTRRDLAKYGVGILGELKDAPCWAGLGAGGDAPKFLVAEGSEKELFLDGTEPAHAIYDRWLIKFPRGHLAIDTDILRSEFIFMQALRRAGFDCAEVRWFESDTGLPCLWVRRFDQEPDGSRRPVESMYAVMKTIGDGARLKHTEVLSMVLPMAENRDQLLAEYLVRDRLNAAIGNVDNHGRNTAFLRTDRGLRLAPAFDLAPMVADPSGISRATVWGRNDRYRDIARHYSENPDYVWDVIKSMLPRFLDALAAVRDDCPESIGSHGLVFQFPKL